ncbi:SWIB/MDM2 domain-containing protein [Plectosphaerella cucumerina]|uniref:SWIB/MDM2 domain-containing protein n=1 Tax=Plectosphaerella cucumerina TaxID=40658 RepID=A0A8K0TQE8_9PEZI|nr:SWIB/MDM2 domain-containing protein [Plectosphaerella cucumerina]
MASPLSSDEQSLYTSIIDGILKTADLTTVTRKKIRAGLESQLGGKDLSAQKNAIKTLIEERFDRFTGPSTDDASDEPVKSEPSPDAHEEDANGYEEEAPARKKQKREVSTEDEDAKLAAELQAQENNLARTRATRGGTTATKKRKAPRKKSAKKVQDDSGAEGSDGEAPKRKAGGGFQKPFTLSYPLAQLVGEPQLSRPQVVKKLWIYIKGHELQDPKDKRQICCDDAMQAVFKQAKVDMFQMNKLIGNHLYPVEEEQ